MLTCGGRLVRYTIRSATSVGASAGMRVNISSWPARELGSVTLLASSLSVRPG